jgi:hypothetical protein
MEGFVPLKCLLTLNGLHGVISQKIAAFIVLDVDDQGVHKVGDKQSNAEEC